LAWSQTTGRMLISCMVKDWSTSTSMPSSGAYHELMCVYLYMYIHVCTEHPIKCAPNWDKY